MTTLDETPLNDAILEKEIRAFLEANCEYLKKIYYFDLKSIGAQLSMKRWFEILWNPNLATRNKNLTRKKPKH
jgi:hypothetical protein